MTGAPSLPVKVSVVVPVWNPGPNLGRCVESLLAQTMPVADYELLLVDDGSTDGTAQRLDALAAAHPQLVRVLHIPASGWPGKPRNVGIDAARGEFVHLVDNDDTLPHYALQAMYDAGVAASADVVMGRPASDFRGLNHTLYRRPSALCTLAECPQLTETLTPHKMFRRSLLVEHGIRFPEGPVPLEDQMFVMRAYVHASSVVVLSDRPYYFYLRRVGSGRNAGDRAIDPVKQCSAVEQVLDIVEADVADPQLRDRLFRRFYRINLLARLSERSMLDYDDAQRAALVGEIRRVVTTRFGAGVNEGAGVAHRTQGRLLIDDDVPEMVALAQRYGKIGVGCAARNPRWRDAALLLDVDVTLNWDDQPLRCEPVDGGWALPSELAPTVPVADRLLDRVRDEPDVEVSLVSRTTSVSIGITDGLHLDVDDAGLIRARGTVAIDPSSASFGRALTDGLWDLLLRVRFGGWNRSATVRLDAEALALLRPLVTDAGLVVIPFAANSIGSLALDVGQWLNPLAATVASTSTLAPDGRRGLRLGVDVLTSPACPAAVQLLLEPLDGTPGGLVAAAGRLSAAGGRAAGAVRLPRLAADGCWRPWLRIADTGAGVAAALPWRVRTTQGRLSTVASADPPD